MSEIPTQADLEAKAQKYGHGAGMEEYMQQNGRPITRLNAQDSTLRQLIDDARLVDRMNGDTTSRAEVAVRLAWNNGYKQGFKEGPEALKDLKAHDAMRVEQDRTAAGGARPPRSKPQLAWEHLTLPPKTPTPLPSAQQYEFPAPPRAAGGWGAVGKTIGFLSVLSLAYPSYYGGNSIGAQMLLDQLVNERNTPPSLDTKFLPIIPANEHQRMREDLGIVFNVVHMMTGEQAEDRLLAIWRLRENFRVYRIEARGGFERLFDEIRQLPPACRPVSEYLPRNRPPVGPYSGCEPFWIIPKSADAETMKLAVTENITAAELMNLPRPKLPDSAVKHVGQAII